MPCETYACSQVGPDTAGAAMTRRAMLASAGDGSTQPPVLPSMPTIEPDRKRQQS